MQPEAFTAYTSAYEAISDTIGGWLMVALFCVLAALPLSAITGKRASRLQAQSFVLSIGVISLILGSYYFPASGSLRVISLLLGGALICAYASFWGFFEPPAASPSRHTDLVACGIIAASTLLKFTFLEEWPLVLTDYAATTGVTTIERYFYNGPPSHSLLPRTYLESGGTSPLHAPLLRFLFEMFGFTTFAVRSAEVLPSILALFFLWLWLRISLSRGWALAGLALFSFSAEHLSQSRMGTFYSVSQGVAIAAVWLWTALLKALAVEPTSEASSIAKSDVRPSRQTLYVIGLLLTNAAVVWCYKPTQAVWILSAILTCSLLLRGRIQRTRPLLLLAGSVALALCSYYLLYQPFLLERFPLRRPMLASDTPIWQKAWRGDVTTFIESPTVIVANFFRNAWWIAQESLEYSPVKDAIYQPLTALTMILACGGLFSRRWWLISLIVVVGMLPSLTTFPLDRRSLLMRSTIPLCATLLAYECLALSRILVRLPTIRLAISALIGMVLALLPFQGSYRLARFNGPVGVGPSYGPEYVYDMISHLQSMSEHHSIVIMNPGLGVDKFRMAFARTLYASSTPAHNIQFTTIQPQDTALTLPRTKRPTVYAVLNEESRTWLVPWMRANIPGIEISARKEKNRVLYWFGIVSDTSAPRTSQTGIP